MDAARAIPANDPDARIVFLTQDDSRAVFDAALEAGALGFLIKTASAKHLSDKIRRASRGEPVFDDRTSAMARARLRGAGRAGDTGPHAGPRGRTGPDALSGRELEVLTLAADGLTYTEIGERLHIGMQTVKTHMAHIYDKFGVGDRTAAVKRAIEQGLLDIHPR